MSWRAALAVWLRIGCLSFGGPAGQIALMQRMLVDERRWISETRFLHALNYCMLLPGPEAQQLATYVGWLLHGVRGGLAAGVLFVLPGWLVMVAICAAYVHFGATDWMQGMLFGVQAATLTIVVHALQRVARRALRHPALYLVAAAAFVAIFAFGIAFPLIILAAALLGGLGAWLWPAVFAAGRDAQAGPPARRPDARRSARVLLGGLALWWLPVLALVLLAGSEHVFTLQALFFSKMAVVTFGGAYAVLAYMAQQAVAHHGWLSADQMIQGLGLAETTPGPLILVLVWVAFLGAWAAPGALDPLLAGVLGAALATWVSFVPCFTWIFLGAPYIESLRGLPWLNAALTAITAAVVGVILNLGVWFGLHVLFAHVGRLHAGPLHLSWPDPMSLDVSALILALLAWPALHRIGLLPTLAACGAVGVVLLQLRG